MLQVMYRNKPGIEEKIEFFFFTWIAPRNITPYTKFALRAIAEGRWYTEYDWS
jgi:hypothetical protein